jgi:hypothetical protein
MINALFPFQNQLVMNLTPCDRLPQFFCWSNKLLDDHTRTRVHYKSCIPSSSVTNFSPFALSTLHILNFKLPVKIGPQPQPLQDSFLHP